MMKYSLEWTLICISGEGQGAKMKIRYAQGAFVLSEAYMPRKRVGSDFGPSWFKKVPLLVVASLPSPLDQA